jgi:transglutaminase-like putative cysteine protease
LTLKQGFLYTGHKAILKKQGIRKGEVMRKIRQIYVVMAVFIVSLFVIQTFAFATFASIGDTQYAEAEQFETKAYYQKALELYKAARPQYLKTGNAVKAQMCRDKIFKMTAILIEFPLSEEQAMAKLNEVFEGFSAEEKKALIGKLKGERVIIDGNPRYFEQFTSNILFRHPELRKRLPKIYEHYNVIAKKYGDIIFRQLDNTYMLKQWNSYINPQTYIADVKVDIPRKELPEKGIYRLWIPAPILLDSQRDVRVISIEPQKYLKRTPQLDYDIGSAYFEIPLDTVKEDIHISMKYSFTHYEQYFTVDPGNVGEYDRTSELYRHYTSSSDNIIVNPEIKRKALEMVGNEKNPYLQAKRIYYEVVNKYRYSYMPHLYLYETLKPESLFVLENGYGDCGSQSMLFAALCRSIGIPARAIGGMLLTPGSPSTHFWAEFYIPNYGWIPVDPTIDEVVLYSDELTEGERKKVHEYFFGHLDNRRMVIQKDADIPVEPRERERSVFNTTLQIPKAECETMEDLPIIPALKGYDITIETQY